MKRLDLTLPAPEENLACDEALLDACDCGGPEVLRFWEPRQHFVVVGYSNRIEREVNVAACRRHGAPILRRCSGGGTVLQGPGCLNYSLILRIDSDPALRTVTGTNGFMMERNRAAVETLLSSDSHVSVRGHTDLVIGDRKFSGNAQRRKRRAVLFHGTFLRNFDLALVNQLLPMPSKQPDYRAGRGHGDFLTNLNVSAVEVKAALRLAWRADELLTDPPVEAVQLLVTQKYAVSEWSMKIASR